MTFSCYFCCFTQSKGGYFHHPRVPVGVNALVIQVPRIYSGCLKYPYYFFTIAKPTQAKSSCFYLHIGSAKCVTMTMPRVSMHDQIGTMTLPRELPNLCGWGRGALFDGKGLKSSGVYHLNCKMKRGWLNVLVKFAVSRWMTSRNCLLWRAYVW